MGSGEMVAVKQQSLKAVGLMVVGMMFIPLGDSFAKLAAEASSYNGVTIAWTRFVIGMLIVLPLALLSGQFNELKEGFWRAQILRGVLLSSGIGCIITAVSLVPLADAYGAFFIGPVVATLLARFVLGEVVRRVEWMALAIGFIGIMLILKPGSQISTGQLFALAAGCFYGAYLTATRWAARVGPPLAQLAGQLCVGAILLMPLAVHHFYSLQIEAPLMLLGSGVSSGIGNLLAIMALGYARAGLLSPLVYSQLVSATLIGWLVFADFPDVLTGVGLLIVFVAGLSPMLLKSTKA